MTKGIACSTCNHFPMQELDAGWKYCDQCGTLKRNETFVPKLFSDNERARVLQMTLELEDLRTVISNSEAELSRLKPPRVVPPSFPIDQLGLYRIHWTEEAGGGISVASVGQDEAGNFWFAPTNWLGGKGRVPSFCWTDVAKVVLIATQEDQQQRAAIEEQLASVGISKREEQISFPDESIVLEMEGSEHELFMITRFECRMLTGPLLGLGGEFAAKGLEGQEHIGKECTFHGVRTDVCVGKFQAILVSWNPCGFYIFESTRSFTRPEPVYGEPSLRKAYGPWLAMQQAKELSPSLSDAGDMMMDKIAVRLIHWEHPEWVPGNGRGLCGKFYRGQESFSHSWEYVTCKDCLAARPAERQTVICRICGGNRTLILRDNLKADCHECSVWVLQQRPEQIAAMTDEQAGAVVAQAKWLCHFARVVKTDDIFNNCERHESACGYSEEGIFPRLTHNVELVTCESCLACVTGATGTITGMFTLHKDGKTTKPLPARAAPQQIQEAIAELEEVNPDFVRDS